VLARSQSRGTEVFVTDVPLVSDVTVAIRLATLLTAAPIIVAFGALLAGLLSMTRVGHLRVAPSPSQDSRCSLGPSESPDQADALPHHREGRSGRKGQGHDDEARDGKARGKERGGAQWGLDLG
jgi:hypothetical protein